MLKNFYPTSLSFLFCLLLGAALPAQMPGGGNTRPCQEDGMISVAFSGATEIATCTDDESMDRVRFQVMPFAQAFAYVVVDEAGVIQYIGRSNFINFDLLPGGTLRVYAFSYYGRITASVGDVFADATLSRPCFGLTTNFVTVNNGASDAIIIESALDRYSVCPGDGIDDIVSVSSPAANVTYLITTPSGELLSTSTDSDINFESAPTGVCYVYAFAGNLPDEFSNVSELVGITGCGTGLSLNFIIVDRQDAEGGTIATADGQTRMLICPGDGVDDVVDFVTTGGSPDVNRLVVTDANNVIIGLPTGNSVNFDDAGTGVCRVWSVTYTGTFIGMIGDTAGISQLANGCTDVSDNFVEINRAMPNGGTLATLDGATEVTTCPGDGNADIISFANTGAAAGSLLYIITDGNGDVLGTSNTPEFDVEGAGVGNCRIYSLTFQGQAIVTGANNIADDDLATSCFAVSDNFISVIRTTPNGGTVATADGETEINICPGDGMDDFVTFVSTGAAEGNFTFVVTDSENVILGIPSGDMVNFDGAGEGVCRLWGLSYSGDITAEVGDNAATTILASGCFSLSNNFVTVVREPFEGGTVALASGATAISICPGDGIADVLNFTTAGGRGDNFTFLVTDGDGLYLTRPLGTAIDFESVATGVCRVYGLYYAGDITVEGMQDVNNTSLATGCFALSDNFVTVVRQEAVTGAISTEDGETSIMACPGDNVPDAFRFDSTGTSLENFNYVVTDTNNIVITVAFTDRVNFELFPEGTCRVYGLGYDGVIIGRPGDTLGVNQLSTQCSAISENFVTVVKALPAGGTVATTDGATEVTLCPLDGVSDIVTAAATGAAGDNYVFLATTADNVILTTSTDGTFDFDGAGFGTCRIWGLAYQGELLSLEGLNAGTEQLATGCSSLSDNFVTVAREDLRGGMVSATGGLTETFTCPGDGVPDVLRFFANDASEGDYQFLITDENNTILAIVDGDSFDFEPAGEGVCRIWGFAYAGEVTAAAGDDAATATLASGCFALSDNFITVTRETPDGGSISLVDGRDMVDVCSGVESEPALELFTTSLSSNYTYVIVQADSFALTTFDSTFNFNRAQAGEYRIYGLAFAGNLIFNPGQNIFTDELATSCFELSESFVTVNVTQVDGGTILGNSAEINYFCPENNADGLVRFTTTSSMSESNYQYVIATNTDFPVVVATIDAGVDSFEFGSLPLMDLRVYAISYDGDFLAGPGSALFVSPLATGCVDLSDNFVLVLNDTPEAGEISFDDVSPTGIACTENGDGTISVSSTSESFTGYAVIVTDTFNVVQLVSLDQTSVDLGSLPEGDYRVYGLAYTGSVTVQAGDDLFNAVLADNCFELTTEFLDVTQGGSIDAGMILNLTTEGTGDTILFCLAEGDNPIVVVDATVDGPNYRYIVTDADGRVRATNLLSDIIPFTALGPGEYRIYGVNYTGQLLIGINQNIETSLVSSECGTLTSNFLTVIYTDPDGGTVTTTDGETEVRIEIEGSGNDVSAMLSFMTTSDSLDSYVYVVTDEDNNILGLNTTGTVNFGPAGVGVCRLWGLAYTGDILAMVGDDAANTVLTSGCFALSDNFVTVTRVDEEGLDNEAEDDAQQPGDSEVSMVARPNPTSGSAIYLDLSSLDALPDGNIYVRDMNGVMYGVQPLVGGQHNATVRLDISGLPSGMYFVQLASESGMQSVRFMKN